MNFTWEPVSDREGERDEETERESQDRQGRIMADMFRKINFTLAPHSHRCPQCGVDFECPYSGEPQPEWGMPLFLVGGSTMFTRCPRFCSDTCRTAWKTKVRAEKFGGCQTACEGKTDKLSGDGPQ